MTDRSNADGLVELAARLVEQARARGADVAEASARSGWELTAKVRLGERELIQEAGHRSVALKVLKEQRVAITSTSDCTDAGLERCVNDALELASLSEPDPFAGPADAALLSRGPYPELELFDASVDELDAAEAVRRAIEAESAALQADARLTLSQGATLSRVSGWSALVLSSGFTGVQRGSYVSLAVSPVVEDSGGKKRRGSYWTAHRHLGSLEPGVRVGQIAAERTLRQLGARKVETCQAPVVFDADAARSLLGCFVGCANGGAVWRKSSYLASREHSEVASPLVNIVDDPLIPRAPASRPFDGEGLASRRNVLVHNGRLEMFLLDSYSARKLDKASTASARRASGGVSAATTNVFIEPGALSPEEIIASTERGLFVTEMMGFGFNAVTGDF